MKKVILSIITISAVAIFSCKNANVNSAPNQNAAKEESGNVVLAAQTSNEFNAYWFAGKAEISSYDFYINRYAQDRNGKAVFVFVTEDFSKAKQVKLDDAAKNPADRVPVLKLNAVYRFQTGIYDYSMMTSLFSPIDYAQMPHALKSNATVQDWCGQVFSQINLRGKQYQIEQFSYFETEGDEKKGIETDPSVFLEDELLTRLRLNPASLPTGKVKIVPNLTYTRIRHKKVDALPATLSFADTKTGVRTLTAKYDSGGRRVEIDFEAAFPHKILRFAEFDGSTKLSEGKLKKTIQSDYWAKNSNEYGYMREELGI